MKLLLCSILIVLFSGLSYGQPEFSVSTFVSGVGSVNSSLQNCYEVNGVVTNVVDGDTLDVSVTSGNTFVTNGDVIRIRLADVDCPETRGSKSCQAGKDASEFTRKTLSNQVVWLDLDNKTGKDKYGRWIAVIYIDGVNFNKELLIKGYATVDDYTNNEFDPKSW